MKRIAALFVPALLSACSGSDSGSGDGLPLLAEDRAHPQMALADHVLGNYFSSNAGPRLTTCIATFAGSEAVALAAEDELVLMRRYPSLAPFARCVQIDGGWQDADTGAPAAVFTLHSFSCADLATCSGFGGFMAGATSSMTSRYDMQFDGRRWNITRDDQIIADQPSAGSS